MSRELGESVFRLRRPKLAQWRIACSNRRDQNFSRTYDIHGVCRVETKRLWAYDRGRNEPNGINERLE